MNLIRSSSLGVEMRLLVFGFYIFEVSGFEVLKASEFLISGSKIRLQGFIFRIFHASSSHHPDVSLHVGLHRQLRNRSDQPQNESQVSGFWVLAPATPLTHK